MADLIKPEDPPHRGCDNCGKPRITTPWLGEGSALDYVHGNYANWCKVCQLQAKVKHAYEVEASISYLTGELRDAEAEAIVEDATYNPKVDK